jgi:hypothetical protein
LEVLVQAIFFTLKKKPIYILWVNIFCQNASASAARTSASVLGSIGWQRAAEKVGRRRGVSVVYP